MRKLTPNKVRRLAILLRAYQGCCSTNIKWAFARSDEPQMKWLIKKGYIFLRRDVDIFRRGGKGVTMARITADGIDYLEKYVEKYSRLAQG